MSRKSHKGGGLLEGSGSSASKPPELSEEVLGKPSENSSGKEYLLGLHKQLKDLGVNRLSQLENLIAKAE